MRSLKGLRIDVYARVSQKGDERQRSTGGQLEDCCWRVTEAGGTVAEQWVDEGRSAWNPRVKRLRWHLLMARLEEGKVDGVIVFDLARFSRRPIEGERLIAAAERGLVVLDSEGEYDLTSASGKKAFRDQMSAAAYESDRQSSRIRRGKALKAARGESNHSGRPWGFEEDGITPREPEATELRSLVRRLLDDGKNLSELQADLNERGVKTSLGGSWGHRALRLMLMRPRNAGLASLGKQITGKLVGVDEPIIAREDWDDVVAMFTARKRGRPATDTYLFSGLIHCRRCGNTLGGRPRGDGSGKRDYWCAKRVGAGGRVGCSGTSANMDGVDEHGKALVLAILADPRHAAKVEEEARAVTAEREQLEGRLEQAERTAIALSARLAEEEMPLARYDAAIAPLDRKIKELQAKLKALPARAARKASKEELEASLAMWEARWLVSTIEQRRVLIRRALVGRRLVVMPADRAAPRRFDPKRLKIVKAV